MLNPLASFGLTLGLLAELSTLEKRATVLQPSKLPGVPAWEPSADPAQSRETALTWLIANAPAAAANEKRRPWKVVPAGATVTLTDCQSDERVVCVSDASFHHYYVIDNDRGGWLNRERINGLFGFAQAIAWPMWVNERCVERIENEPNLSQATAAAVRRYREFEQEKRDLLCKSITAVLAPHPYASALYEAVENDDSEALRRFRWGWRLRRAGVAPEQLRQHIDLLQKGHPDAADGKRNLRLWILLPILTRRLERGKTDWHLPAYGEVDADSSKELARFSYAACSHYAEEFRRFFLRHEVLAIERDLFSSTRMPDSRPFAELIEELAGAQKPLTLTQMGCMEGVETPGKRAA
ncbi:MAG TPA: hypothetical protein VIL30_08850 [Ramlibacter sp.]|jgi:hypothetical protein